MSDGRKKERCPHCQSFIHIKRMEKHIRAVHAPAPTTPADEWLRQQMRACDDATRITADDLAVRVTPVPEGSRSE